jgi:hypothetical protein
LPGNHAGPAIEVGFADLGGEPMPIEPDGKFIGGEIKNKFVKVFKFTNIELR